LRNRKQQSHAYTLIEVLVVVAILGVAGAIVVPQFLQPSTISAQAASRMIMADIQLTQSEAITHQKSRHIIFDIVNGNYQITDENNKPVAVSWKAGAEYEVSIKTNRRFNSVSLADANFGGNVVLTFDDLGAPLAGGNIDIVSPGAQYRISVAPFTGRLSIDAI